MYEAVDQRGLQVGTGGGIDTAGGDEAVFLSPQEFCLPVRLILLLLDLGQCPGDALAHVVYVGFLTLGVLFDQHFAGDFLFRQRCVLGRRRNVGQ